MINCNNKIGFNNNGNAFLVYHKFDENGITQVYSAQFINASWSIKQLTEVVTSTQDGMRMNQANSFPSPYILLWESMPNNRDEKPAVQGLSSQLRLITFG